MSGENESELINNIFLGEVASVQNYGAFIRIPGNKEQGLVHRSQISATAVDDATEVLQKGERVWCKVISVQDDGKIGLSMKVVNQGSGHDLDPNGVQIHQDELKRKSMPPGGRRRKIELEAVLKTTCSKCGVVGHLSKDCFQSASGKIYELIPEDDIDVTPNTETANAVLEPKKAKKRKKEKHKKEKKKKKRKSSSSDNESDSDSESDHRDRKKHKKRNRSRSRSPKSKKKKKRDHS